MYKKLFWGLFSIMLIGMAGMYVYAGVGQPGDRITNTNTTVDQGDLMTAEWMNAVNTKLNTTVGATGGSSLNGCTQTCTRTSGQAYDPCIIWTWSCPQ